MDIKSSTHTALAWYKEKADMLIFVCSLVVIALIFFGVGILYAQHFLFPAQPFTIQESLMPTPAMAQATVLAVAPNTAPTPKISATPSPAQNTSSSGAFYASRTGKNYYKSSCKSTVKEANKVYFTSEEDAQKAGYTPSASCFK